MNEIKQDVLLGQDKQDWIAGANSPIQRKILMESGNWRSVSIPNEIQFINYGKANAYESMMCVAFNEGTDAIEYIMMQMLRLNLIPAKHTSWLTENKYFKDGVLNFNERYTAIKGETTNQGAYQYKVANGMKNWGLVPQDSMPFADNFEDNINPKFISPELEELGLAFKKRFYINYEWVNIEDTKEFLKYSPLSCVGQYADGEGILKPPTNNGHCMLQVDETDEYREIDDSYWRQFKKYNKNSLQSFMAFYITPIIFNIMFDTTKFLSDNNNKIVRNTNTGAYGVIYNKTPLHITAERAGLFMLDRDARKLIGKSDKVEITDSDWNLLGWKNF